MSKKETLKMNELKRNFLLRFKEVKILFKWDYEKKNIRVQQKKNRQIINQFITNFFK